MKTRHSLCAFAVSLMLLLVLFSSTAAAVITMARPSCGQWVKERTPDGRTAQSYRFWLLGYVSGMAVSSGTDALRDTDNASIELWMDNYCRANPLKSVDEGGAALFNELAQKTKRQ
jgi:hypothetical protein